MRVLFVSSGGKNGKIGAVTKAQGSSIEEEGVEVDYYLITGTGAAAYIKHIPKLRKYIAQGSYDVIHAHYGISAITARLASFGKPLVASFMGSDIYGQPKNDGSYNPVTKFFAFLSKLFARFFFNFTIVKSAAILDKLYSNTTAELIPNGVDLTTFKPVDKDQARKHLTLHSNKKYVFFAGKPETAVKNYLLAKEAVAILCKDALDVELIYAKGVDHHGVNLYMNAADALLLTSFHEGSPNVIKEALAVGLPIVSTDVGDVAERIEGVNGCYLCSFDPEDAAEKLKSALLFQGRTNGREAIKELDSKVVAKRIIAIYEKLLKK